MRQIVIKNSKQVAVGPKITPQVASHHAKDDTKPIYVFVILIWLIFAVGMVTHYYGLF